MGKKKTLRSQLAKKIDKIDSIMTINELANYDKDLVYQVKNIAYTIAEKEENPDLFDKVFFDISYSVMYQVRSIDENNVLTGKEFR